MNHQLTSFARQTIRDGLAKLPPDWTDKFNRMYGSVETMPDEKLDRAMEQVEASLKKLNIK